MEHRFYTTGQFASKASITVRALRHYDRIGLLPPSRHTASGYRLYTEEDWLILQRILVLRFLEFSLDDIKDCLHMEPEEFKDALTRQRDLLRSKRNQIAACVQFLEDLMLSLDTGDWGESSLTEVIQVESIMSQQTTLGIALKTLETQLTQDNRPHFIPLLELKAIQDAIRVAQEAYEPLPPGEGEYYRLTIQPLLRQIVEDGVFPPNAEWGVFYELQKDSPVRYQGLGVSLEIWTPTQVFKGFSLPILDVWYGRWVE